MSSSGRNGGPWAASPGNTAFVLNRFDAFKASLADIFVADGVKSTLIGPGTLEDHGVCTVIVPLPSKKI